MVIRTAAELEAAHGAQLRRPPLDDVYTQTALKSILASLRPPIRVSIKVCRTWLCLHRPGGRSRNVTPGSMEAPRTAAQLDACYGDELRAPPFSALQGSRALRLALAARASPVHVSDQVCRTWLATYRVASNAVRVIGVGPLEDQYGQELRGLAALHSTPSALEKVLRERDPPLAVTVSILHNWMQRYGADSAQTLVHSAGQLEMLYGDRIRAQYGGQELDARSIAQWLFTAESVSVAVRNCQTWIDRDWSTAGKVLRACDLETRAGEQLRLEEYAPYFRDEDLVRELQVSLAEGQPPLRTTVPVLMSWYARYHPDGGPLRYATAAELEAEMGDEIRRVYVDLEPYALVTALSRRLKPVLVSRQVRVLFASRFCLHALKGRGI